MFEVWNDADSGIRDGARLVVEHASPAGHELHIESLAIVVPDAEERVLLRAAQIQPRDQMDELVFPDHAG